MVCAHLDLLAEVIKGFEVKPLPTEQSHSDDVWIIGDQPLHALVIQCVLQSQRSAATVISDRLVRLKSDLIDGQPAQQKGKLMKPIPTLCAVSVIGIMAAPAVLAEPTKTNPRADTAYEANFAGPDVDPVTKNASTSNWPGLPDRQAGKSYSKLIVTTYGFRERNAESGRN